MRRAILIGLLLASSGVLAENVWRTPNPDKTWEEECGSCHMLFPPALLSGDNWHSLMQGLERHFGADASLDEAARDKIAAFLEANAAKEVWGHSSGELRITDTLRFMESHRGAVRMYRKGRLKSLSDCMACHKDLDQDE